MWNPESFQVLLCNLESWPLESRIQLKEFGIKVRIGIQNPSSTDEESGFQVNPWHGIQSLRPSWLSLHGATSYKNTCLLLYS